MATQKPPHKKAQTDAHIITTLCEKSETEFNI